VANLQDNTVSVIDGATNTVTATVTVGNGADAVGVDPTTDTVYVANQDDNTVSVINGATNTVTATVTVGNEPDAVGVDPITHTVYVANSFDNTVSVINGATNTVTATVTVGSWPAGVGFDPIGALEAYLGGLHDAAVIAHRVHQHDVEVRAVLDYRVQAWCISQWWAGHVLSNRVISRSSSALAARRRA
jgi:YVTN family beta-propeller protein